MTSPGANGFMLEKNPYKVQAGTELDRFIHGSVMNAPAADACPAYSTEDKIAKRVLSRLRECEPAVIVGRTGLQGRSWFARYESNAMDGTEVFAETFALAVCRLAVLRLNDHQSPR